VLCLICSDVKERDHVLWVDNYSKVMYMNRPNVDVGYYHDHQWMGSGMSIINKGGQLRNVINLNGHGQPTKPAMPPQLFSDNNIALLLHGLDAFGVNDPNPLLYHNSLVRRYKVATVPIRLVADNLPTQNLRDRHQQHYTSLQDFQPCSIRDINIGSNQGVAQVMSEMETKINDEVRSGIHRYHFMATDVNIFSRTIKVPFYVANFPFVYIYVIT